VDAREPKHCARGNYSLSAKAMRDVGAYRGQEDEYWATLREMLLHSARRYLEPFDALEIIITGQERQDEDFAKWVRDAIEEELDARACRSSPKMTPVAAAKGCTSHFGYIFSYSPSYCCYAVPSRQRRKKKKKKKK